jgi:hypothetical protein
MGNAPVAGFAVAKLVPPSNNITSTAKSFQLPRNYAVDEATKEDTKDLIKNNPL